MPDETDEELLARILKRDAEALVEYVEQRRPQFLAFIQKNLSDGLRRKVDAEDILQEAQISAVQGLADTAIELRDPFPWMCQQIERRIIDAHRRYFGAQKRTAEKEVGLGSGSGGGDTQGGGLINMLVASMTTPSQAFSRNQREFKLLQALEQLPADNREALKLRYVDGLPSKEIAERLGRTDGAVRVLLTRSLARLQTLLLEESEFRTEPPSK